MSTVSSCRFVLLTSLTFCLLPALARPASGGQFTHPTLHYTVTYPDTWHAVRIDNVLDLMNVKEYLHGGVLPHGGAGINIQVFGPDQSDDSVLDNLMSEPDATRSSESIGGRPVRRLEETFASGLGVLKRIAISCRIDGKQFLFMLDYYAGDPHGSEWQQVLDGVVSSVSVSKGR